MTHKIQIKGKTYDLEDPSDLAKVQALLVPPNWPVQKKDCVRAFQAVASMLCADLVRALAFNWKNITKIAQEEAAEGGKATVSCGFSFEVDQTAPTVAAIAGQKLSFSAKFSTKMKPRVLDLNQPELFEKLSEDGGEPMDLDDLTAPPEEKKPDEPKDKGDGKVVKLPGAKGKRGPKKKSTDAPPAE